MLMIKMYKFEIKESMQINCRIDFVESIKRE